MDCRASLGLALCLLSVAAGCQHQATTVLPNGAATQPTPRPEPPPDPSEIKKMASRPQKDPPAAVLVSWGDFKAGEACAADIPPDRQQQIRDAARQDYERALKSEPKNVSAYLGLARLHTSMHNPERAIETYRTALQLAPNNAALWYEMGLCHNAQRNWGAALECLNRAAQIDPANRYYSNSLGIVLAEAGRYEDSLRCFVRSNGDAMGYYRLAQTLQRLQQPELSRQYLDVALQKDSKLATMLARQTGDNGNSDAAAPQVEQTMYQPASAPPPRGTIVQVPQTATDPFAAAVPQPIPMPALNAENAAMQQFLPPPPPSVNVPFEQPQ
jgi:tetratricopeptide (TPR) repeat protein